MSAAQRMMLSVYKKVVFVTQKVTSIAQMVMSIAQRIKLDDETHSSVDGVCSSEGGILAQRMKLVA
jgi:hypothetical protein